MKQKFLALILLILFFANNHVNAQFRHFPHGHEFLMEYKGSFYKVKFDTTVVDSSHVNSSMYALWDYASTPCSDFMKKNTHGCFEDRFYSDSVYLWYYGLARSFRISRHIKPGNIFSIHNSNMALDTLIYLKDSLYIFNDIQDSAAVLYPFANGEVDYSIGPVLLGHTLGWLDMGFLVPTGEKFKQYSLLKNGIPDYYPSIDWKVFFPERTGDFKIWYTMFFPYPSPAIFPDVTDSVVFRLDSFLSVSVYPDSFVRIILQRQMKSDYTFLPVDTVHSTITKKHLVAQYFEQSKIGSRYHLSSFSNGYADVFDYLWMITDPIASQRIYVSELHYRINTLPCNLKDNSDPRNIEEYVTNQGFISQLNPYPQVFMTIKSCVAFKLGQSTKGDYSILGVNNPVQKNLHVYPNPTSSVLNMDAMYNGSQYEIMDLAGATLLSGTLSENSIAVDGLAEGTYFLRVLPGDGSVVSGKFVKATF